MAANTWIRWFDDLGSADIALVGGKNASLGELTRALAGQGIRVPSGFATLSEAYRRFLEESGLQQPIEALLRDYQAGERALQETGRAIRRLVAKAPFPVYVAESIRAAYRALSARYDMDEADVGVRSSATAEDLPEASFAGQQESFLGIRGEDELLEACRRCYASLFTDRAISYREAKGFDHMQVALSVGVQKMVRADKAGAGVLFTIDTETGFPNVVLISAAWGLGENVVKGTVTPDQYMVFKPVLEDAAAPVIEKTLGTKDQKLIYADPQEPSQDEIGKGGRAAVIEKRLGAKQQKLIYALGGSRVTRNVPTTPEEQERFVLSEAEMLQLARWGVQIEEHYGRPMDIEWAKDGETEELFIVQARPETVQAAEAGASLRTYRLEESGERLVAGLRVGSSIAAGPVRRVRTPADLARVEDGAVLVAEMTDPDWGPALRRVAAVVTDRGGRTCHAAIVSRELGVPAVVGTGQATAVLREGQAVTVSCAEGEEGVVYAGRLAFASEEVDLSEIPETRTRVMLNLASPEAALQWWRLPADGIGLARMEFVIAEHVKVHPMALVRFDQVEDPAARAEIERLTRGYDRKEDYFVEVLARGLAKIAASQYPHPVIVRTSDFKTNEYAHLVGGVAFEPTENNPMLGWRGASRYYSEGYREGFALECRALKRVREEMGLTNVAVMIPFCRTPEEAERVLATMAEHGLRRGEEGLAVYVMCELPSNVVLTKEFAAHFDGFSIGSNDLTQLVLGVDRDSDRLAHLFDERHKAVRRTIRDVIQRAHQAGVTVGLCGQAPSDHPEFAAFLVEAGIDSISVNPDSFLAVKARVAEAEVALPERASRAASQHRSYMTPD